MEYICPWLTGSRIYTLVQDVSNWGLVQRRSQPDLERRDKVRDSIMRLGYDSTTVEIVATDVKSAVTD